MIIAELSVKPDKAGEYNARMRRIISEVIPMISMFGIMLMLAALSASILPPVELLIMILIIAIALTAILWRSFIKLHSRLQIAFIERFEKEDN